jgi:hypothetical protein
MNEDVDVVAQLMSRIAHRTDIGLPRDRFTLEKR